MNLEEISLGIYTNTAIHTPALLGKSVKIERTPESDASGEWEETISAYGVIKAITIVTTGSMVINVELHIYLDGMPTPIKHNYDYTQTVVKIVDAVA